MSRTVLTVDDSKSIRDMVAFTLEAAGYRVVGAENGAEGLQKLAGTPADLIITDLNMPVMNGFDFIRAVRRLPSGAGVPILMLTTESDPGKKAEGKDAGATGWINKPFEAEKLVAVARKLIG